MLKQILLGTNIDHAAWNCTIDGGRDQWACATAVTRFTPQKNDCGGGSLTARRSIDSLEMPWIPRSKFDKSGSQWGVPAMTSADKSRANG